MNEVSPWLADNYAPVADELDVWHLAVEGELPAGLRGTFLRNGPNPAFPPLGRYHVFDGDGMLHGVTLDGEGGARYRNRWIRSPGFEAEQRAGEALFGGLSDFRLPPEEVMAEVGMMKNTANTHVVRHAGRTLALMEAAKPVEVDADLATIGEYDFAGALSGPMTAHPKIDPMTDEMIFFGYSPIPPYLRIHSADAEGDLTWSTSIDLPTPVMMHDFVVTATRVVVFDLPAVFDLDALMAGGEGIGWRPDNGARIGVLDRGAPGDTIRWTEVDPFWVFHFMNAYDDGDAVVVHGCRADRLNTAFGDTELTEAIPPILHRWRIDPGSGVTEERIGDRPGDFPRIDDRRAGLDARYGYLGRTSRWDEVTATFDGVVRHDLHTGDDVSVSFGDGATTGEPVFAADADADDDSGWVLNFVHDADDDTSWLTVLDGETLERVARVKMPRRVPFGFHGSFLPHSA